MYKYIVMLNLVHPIFISYFWSFSQCPESKKVYTDPDPLEPSSVYWHKRQIRIQHFTSMRIRIQIQGFGDQTLKQFTAGKTYFFSSKIAIYLSLCLHKGRPSYRRSLQLSKNIEHFKTWNFFTFLLLCVPRAMWRRPKCANCSAARAYSAGPVSPTCFDV